jgi:hypothetical protein
VFVPVVFVGSVRWEPNLSTCAPFVSVCMTSCWLILRCAVLSRCHNF